MSDLFVNQLQRVGDTTNGIAKGRGAVVYDADSFVVEDRSDETVTGNGASFEGYSKIKLKSGLSITILDLDVTGNLTVAGTTTLNDDVTCNNSLTASNVVSTGFAQVGGNCEIDGGLQFGAVTNTGAGICAGDTFGIVLAVTGDATNPTWPGFTWDGDNLRLGNNAVASAAKNLRIAAVANGHTVPATPGTDGHVEIQGEAAVTVYAGTGAAERITANGTGLGFYGATPVARASAYTQTYSIAARTNAFAATSAYTGQDNAQPGSVYAKVADIEALRQEVLALAKLVNALIDDSQAIGIAQ